MEKGVGGSLSCIKLTFYEPSQKSRKKLAIRHHVNEVQLQKFNMATSQKYIKGCFLYFFHGISVVKCHV